jgi:pimeloyl-ACP methyl ester carboxylesterase
MNDPVEAFLHGSTLERLRMVEDERVAPAIQSYLGERAYAELQALAATVDRDHLSLDAPKNLIFVPGVMGSQLKSETKGGVWWIDARTRNHLNDLALSADGDEDADRNNQIAPFTTDPQYMPFMTAVLADARFNHELFPFDWRKLPTQSADGLRDLVDRMYAENGQVEIHLVGHSMGGLIIRAALDEHGDELWPKLGKVVFIGTPHYGSPAIAGYLKNHFWGFDLLALLGLYINRQTFRSMWGVIAMLPAPRGIYPGTRDNNDDPWTDGGEYLHPCSNFDMYEADAWKLELGDAERKQLQRVLDGAAAFHRRLYEGHDSLPQDVRDRMAVIAGVGTKTLFRLEYESHLFGAWETMNKVTKRVEGDRHREGDGRVPLASAELENVPVRYVRGVHGGLPNIPAVYEAVFRHLSGQEMDLARTPKEALSGHLGLGGDEASEAPALDGTAIALAGAPEETNGELDPGVWRLEDDPAALARLQASLEREELPEFTRVRLL